MATDSKLRQIQERRRGLETILTNLRAELAAREAEANDLKVAERVLLSLSEEKDAHEGQAADREKTVKPEGIPPISEMITSVLADAKKEGKKGLRPQGISNIIKMRWWPEANTRTIGSVAWRMAQRKKLTKRGAIYSLPKVEGSAASTAEPSKSQPQQGAAGSPGGPIKASPVGSTPTASSHVRRDLCSSTAIPPVVLLSERRSATAR
jgi:hypothetical protein